MLGEVWEPRQLAPDADAGEVLGELYVEMLDVGAPALAESLRLIARPGGLPAVFHCAAGKDRTGVLAALVLGLLGVDDDVIVEDYALSARAMDGLVAADPQRQPRGRHRHGRPALGLLRPARPTPCGGSSPTCATSTARWWATCAASAWSSRSSRTSTPPC